MIETILHIFPEIILLGTFFRTLPINGKNSGKLKFSDLTTNATLIEDSTGVTLSTFFNQAVDFRQIAVGTGLTAGPTSSRFFRYEDVSASRKPRLFGPGQINSFSYGGWGDTCNLNWGLYNHSFLINGYCNIISDASTTASSGFSDLIIGGNCNCIIYSGTSSRHNVILNARQSCVGGGRGDIIIGMGDISPGISGAGNSSIINSKVDLTQGSSYNAIISSSRNKYFSQFDYSISGIRESAIISTFQDLKINYNNPTDINNLTVIASTKTCICSNPEVGVRQPISFNNILASKRSLIYGGCLNNTYGNLNTRPSSCSNTILSSCIGKIYTTKHSAILGGMYNRLLNLFPNSQSKDRELLNSSIIAGERNTIKMYDFQPNEDKPIIASGNSILGSYKSCMNLQNSDGNTIIGSYCGYIFSSQASSIISSYKSGLFTTSVSAIISSKNSCLMVSNSSSVIISSQNNNLRGFCGGVDISSMNNSQFSNYYGKSGIRISTYGSYFGGLSGIYTYDNQCVNSIIASKNSNIRSYVTANPLKVIDTQYSTILGSLNSKIDSSPNSFIFSSMTSSVTRVLNSVISGYCTQIFNTCQSGSIAGKCNKICFALQSVIIGGYCNFISGSSGKCVNNSVILGGQKQTLTMSSTTMAKNFNFSCASIFENLNSSYCQAIVGNFSNCMYCTLKIRDGFIVL